MYQKLPNFIKGLGSEQVEYAHMFLSKGCTALLLVTTNDLAVTKNHKAHILHKGTDIKSMKFIHASVL